MSDNEEIEHIAGLNLVGDKVKSRKTGEQLKESELSEYLDMTKMLTGASVHSDYVNKEKIEGWEYKDAFPIHKTALNLTGAGWYLCSSKEGVDTNLKTSVVRVLTDHVETIWIFEHAGPSGYSQSFEFESKAV